MGSILLFGVILLLAASLAWAAEPYAVTIERGVAEAASFFTFWCDDFFPFAERANHHPIKLDSIRRVNMRFHSLSSSRLRRFALCSMFALTLAFAVPAALGQKPGASAYFDAYMSSNAVDMSNARGYGNVGFNPDIMSVPGKPLTATRIYSEAGRSVEVTIARDNLGRVHYESAAPEGGPIGVVIYDPIAHTLSQYSITTNRGIENDAEATVTHLVPVGVMVRTVAAAAESASDDAAAATISATATIAKPGASGNSVPSPNDLPRKLVNGIAAVGQRSVQKYGDRQQFFMIQEEWFSPEYAINMRQSVWRQNRLDSNVETKDVVAGEPDPDLFRVPGGYVISKTQ